MLLFVWLLVLVAPLLAQFTGCDFYQSLSYPESVSVYSPTYSAFYATGTMCRWAAVAPPGYKLVLQCTDVVLPSSLDCEFDRIEVSRSGRADLADAHRYCGVGTFTEQSISTSMVIALKVPTTSLGGRLYCTLKTVINPCDCGRRLLSRIVGGGNAIVNEFPMVAAIKTVAAPQDVICGATIISNRYLLTVASCISNVLPSAITVVVGEHDISSATESTYTLTYNILAISINTAFSISPSKNDIAILKTTNEIIFNAGVGIACLPWKFNNQPKPDEQFDSQVIITAGWGTTTSTGTARSSILQKVSLNTISRASCQARMPNIFSTHICTYTAGKDTCQYDTGGGLFYTDPLHGLLYDIGLVSYGIGCAGITPRVSTRVTSYLGWILQNTPGASYCNV